MRRHAMAVTAGPNRQKAAKIVLPVSLFAALLAMLVVVGAASAAKSHGFKELFGSAAEPTFATPQGVAIDQSTGDVLVMDASSPPSIKRYNADGTAANFSALSSNVIDGVGGADATPQEGLSFASASESQIAIDNSGGATDGDIYVTQGSPNLINVFASTGAYLGQLTAAGTTDFSEACGVAVDSAGAVYVGDYGSGIHKFVPAANPVVNVDNTATFTTTSQPCTLAAGSGASAGFIFPAQYSGPISKVDSGTGELKYTVSADNNTTVSVNPATGNVYGATGSTIEEFDASGAGSATAISSTPLSSQVQGVAIRGSTGDIYATRSGQSKVEVFGPTLFVSPDVTTTAVSGNTGIHATLNGTVNPEGVELDECFFEWGEGLAFDEVAPCVESNATIGTGTSPVAVHADISGLQPNGQSYRYRLVAKNPETPAVTGGDQSFNTADTVVTTAATSTTPTSTTLNGTVNPDGVAISECLFEWGTTTSYGETAPCLPGPGGIGAGTSSVAVHADLSGLNGGTVYHYRLKAANANGPILGADVSVQTTGPVIGGTWSEDVVYTEAGLHAEINPESLATTYHFEYGTTTAYGSQTPELPVGSDGAIHEVTRSIGGLTPDTTYHYRVVATNSAAANEGPDRTFTTYAHLPQDTNCPNQVYRVGPAAGLPDCRAYEMVSPVDKNGNDVGASASDVGLEPAGLGFGSSLFAQSSISGEKLAYSSFFPFPSAHSAPLDGVPYIATRTSEGWQTQAIGPPRTQSVFPPSKSLGYGYKLFSPDLSSGWFTYDSRHTLSPDAPAGFANIYRRDNISESYEAINRTTPPLTPPNIFEMELGGVSADEKHVVFTGKDALTPDAPTGINERPRLYDWSGGHLDLVSVLPNGEPNEVGSFFGNHNTLNESSFDASADHAISDDGSRIFWTAKTFPAGPGQLFVRIDGEETISISNSIGGAAAQFWAANSDGTTVFFGVPTGGFEQEGDLYEYDVDSETPTFVAGEVYGGLGSSDDASYLYFASREVLAPGGVNGEANLYVRHNGAENFIAILGGSETNTNSDEATDVSLSAIRRATRVTPDGSHLAFISKRSLTGYDNVDLATGEPDTEVYLYDADTGKLTCASCRPSGARPRGPVGRAAMLAVGENQLYLPKALSDTGNRLFFAAHDALLPQDTNGVQDIYQWERDGAGTCQDADGCLSLLSTGESPRPSEFIDATADGETVFINTNSSIAPQDPGLRDVYAVRVGGGYPPPSEVAPCSGDTCQSPAEAPRQATPASAGFRGEGSPLQTQAARCGAQARRAQKLKKRAKRLLRQATLAHPSPAAEQLRLHGRKLARQAKKLSKQASRCRRANRRTER